MAPRGGRRPGVHGVSSSIGQYVEHIKGDGVTRKKIANQKFLAKQRKFREWANAEHLFELRHANRPTGETRRMLGRESVVLNRELEREFIRALDKSEHARMSRWHLVRDAAPD